MSAVRRSIQQTAQTVISSYIQLLIKWGKLCRERASCMKNAKVFGNLISLAKMERTCLAQVFYKPCNHRLIRGNELSGRIENGQANRSNLTTILGIFIGYLRPLDPPGKTRLNVSLISFSG